MERRDGEEPHAIFGQPELPLADVDVLDAIQRVQLWLATHPDAVQDLDGLSARLYLKDNDTRVRRARRWLEIVEIDQRCSNQWGVLLHGGTETLWLLGEAAHGLVEGLWLASLLCSHAACERHLAGILEFSEDSLPESWRSWGLGRLLEEAQKREIVPSDLWEPLRALNETRKVSAHFKPPLHDGSLMRRAQAIERPDILQSAHELAEADAFSAYETARSLVHRARWP
ncbi:MAG: hypothetical protein QM747_15400 [Nocardioides sp.]